MPVHERRNSTRFPVLKGATYIVGDWPRGWQYHQLGRRRADRKHDELPEDLGLTFDGGRSIRECRVVWRTVTENRREICSAMIDSPSMTSDQYKALA